jgi:hypothetical protein
MALVYRKILVTIRSLVDAAGGRLLELGSMCRRTDRQGFFILG